MDDDIRRRILSRRSVLIAAALATSTTACPKSEPCLSIAQQLDSGASPELQPRVGLSQVYIPPDAGTPASIADSGATEGGIKLPPMDITPDAGPPPTPRPCLTIMRPGPAPTPLPCLKMAPPKTE